MRAAELKREKRIQMDQYNMQLAGEQQAQWALHTDTVQAVQPANVHISRVGDVL